MRTIKANTKANGDILPEPKFKRIPVRVDKNTIILVREGAKELVFLLHGVQGNILRMARVARQEDNREVDGRDQEDYQIALPYSRIKILKAPVPAGEYIVLSKK